MKHTVKVALPNVRERMKPPFKRSKVQPNVPYSRTWAAPFVHGVTETWIRRCINYWTHQEMTYGIIYSDILIEFDPATSTITTFSTPLAIVEGERVDDFVADPANSTVH